LHKGEVLRVGPVEELTKLTDAAAAEVVLELSGDTESINRILPATVVQRARDGDRWKVTVPALDQAALDALVDQFRQADVSLLAIARRRLTLEEAFLEMVRTAGGER
ncbi:MAG: hypothetical protein VB859_12845, partial [Planctomycetaceae bacterium]